MRFVAGILAWGLVGLTTAWAQTGNQLCPGTGQPAVTVFSGGGIVGSLPRTAVHIPYSLVTMNTQVQTLSNGVQITSRQETHEWHDAEGRLRREFRMERNGQMEVQNISIFDPVARTNIILYPKAQVAQLTRFREPEAYQPRPVDKAFSEAMKPEYQPQQQLPSRVENNTELLGTTVILGECAQGTRFTQVVPAGEMGNDGEIRTVQENWYSPRLGIQLRSVRDDPRMGHIVNEVTELHLGAPDPSLFQPPPEYKVFDLTREPAKQ